MISITTEEALTLARQLEANEPMVQDPVALEFFADVATALRSVAAERDAAIARAEKAETEAEKLREAARTAMGHLDDPTGGQHISDMRQASAVLRAAIEPAPAPDATPDQPRRVTVEDDAFLELIADGMAEADRAMRKFPQPNYVISKIAEEAGEVVKAAIHHAENRETAENVLGEMRQLIAMLYRLCVEGDQVHGMAPLIPTGGGDGRCTD